MSVKQERTDLVAILGDGAVGSCGARRRQQGGERGEQQTCSETAHLANMAPEAPPAPLRSSTYTVAKRGGGEVG